MYKIVTTGIIEYSIRGYFCGGFIFVNFMSQSSQKFQLQYMAIYSNENITKIAKSIYPPSPKSQKYLYVKYLAYTVHNIVAL